MGGKWSSWEMAQSDRVRYAKLYNKQQKQSDSVENTSAAKC